MKKSIAVKMIIVLAIASCFSACAGVSVGYGVGFSTGPYGYGGGFYPSVNVGMYGGGYRW